MTDLRTAAQQALESLEIGYDSAQAEAHQFHAAMAGYRPQRHAEMDADVQKIARAITALRAALAEPVQEPVQQALVEADRIMGHDDEATEWRERWAHLFGVAGIPVQEPVAWMDVLENGYKCLAGRPIQGWTPLYAAPPQRPAEPVQEPVACLIGTKGSAFDSPTTKRAYTYAEQPGNVVASRLGLACNAAASQSAGDSIDRGLGLLQELQRQGFGVFDLGAEYAAPPQRPAEPVQDGCDHCNHPMYAAIKCKVCKRVTEPVQKPQCNPHPKAPHGFLRNASHTEDRYVCECEYWDPYEAGYQAGMEAALRAQS